MHRIAYFLRYFFLVFYLGIIRCIIGCMKIPKNISVNMDVLNLIVRIHEFKSAMRVMANLTPPRLLALRKIATIESIGAGMRIGTIELSNREIESVLVNLKTRLAKNNTSQDQPETEPVNQPKPEIQFNEDPVSDSLTDQEVNALIMAAASPSDILNSDEEQAAGYYDGLNRVLALTKEATLTEAHIKELHQVLLGHSKKDSWHSGKYKVSANNLSLAEQVAGSSTKTLQTASPAETPGRMAELLNWLQQERENGQINPLILVAIFIASFIEIRPFQDGNGRMSRLLTRLLLLKTGYHFVVYGSLESVVENSRADYYKAMGNIHASLSSGSPDWQPWFIYFLEMVVEQVRRLNSKLERENQIYSTLPKLSSAIVELAREHGRVTMADAIKLTGSNRNTLKQHFRKLVFQGQLARQGMGAGVWYQMR